MADFTPVSALIGGGLIGASASLLLYTNGRVAGISGILGGIFQGSMTEVRWRAAFIVGLLAAGVLLAVFSASAIVDTRVSPAPLIVLAGLVVGVGVRMGSGCTSGHGVCGIAQLRARSIIATLTFVGVGMATATAMALAGWAS